MARSFGRSLSNMLASEIIRSMDRKKRARLQAENRRIREIQKSIEKEKREKQAAIKKAQKEKYVDSKKNEAQQRTDKVLAYFDMYNKIFFETVRKGKYFGFDRYKKTFQPTSFIYGKAFPQKGIPKLQEVPKKYWIEKIFTFMKKKRLEIMHLNNEEIEKCEKEYNQAIKKYNEDREKANFEWIENEKQRASSVAEHNKKIDKWEEAYFASYEKAINLFAYELINTNNFDMHLINQYRINYIHNEGKLIVEFDIKDREQIFYCEGYRYMIQSEEFRPIKMKSKDINERTKDLLIELIGAIFAIAFNNDIGNYFSYIIVNGYHNNICVATGKIDKGTFLSKDFSNENALLLLRNFWIKIYSQITKGVKPLDGLAEN